MSSLVCIVHCYNSEKFLKECLDSILSQKTKHQFQVLIIDDCSTDNTKKIAYKYVNDINVHFFSTKKNTGLGKQALLELEEEIKSFFNTDYVYRIDADDFIIDSSKFEKQISFLDKNLECVGICHHYKVDDQINNNFHTEDSAVVGVFSSSDQVRKAGREMFYNHTATYLFRNVNKDILPTIFKKTQWATGDLLYTWDMMRHGSICFTNDVMTVYRVHNKGVYSLCTDEQKNKMNRSLMYKVFYFMTLRDKLLFINLKINRTLKFYAKFIIQFFKANIRKFYK